MINPRIRVNRYFVNPDEAHIVLKEDPDHETFLILEEVCPAGLYWHDDQGYHHDYRLCLECGACAILDGGKVFVSWNYPKGPYGIDRGE